MVHVGLFLLFCLTRRGTGHHATETLPVYNWAQVCFVSLCPPGSVFPQGPVVISSLVPEDPEELEGLGDRLGVSGGCCLISVSGCWTLGFCVLGARHLGVGHLVPKSECWVLGAGNLDVGHWGAGLP